MKKPPKRPARKAAPQEPKPYSHEQVRVPIYGVQLHVIVAKKCTQIREARVALQHLLGPVDPGDQHVHRTALCTYNGSNFALFFAEEQLSHGIVAHEVFHAAHRILEFVEASFSGTNHEPFAYLAEWITNWVYQHVRPKKSLPA